MTSSAIEEYLQAIYTLADETGSAIAARLAEFLRVSPPAVSEMLHRLARERLIVFDDRKAVHLTSAGRTVAESIVRRHRLSERFLVDMLGYPWWQTHEEAERIEHALTPEMEERLRRALGDPQACPHGNPMPGVAARPTRTLGSVVPGEEATIERIPDQFEHEPGFLEYLDGHGLRPGVRVRLIERTDGALRVAIGGRECELRPDCADKVWVQA
ncbi:MAG: metal-dependent transcriptional regulator [Chloroflexota bacterium]|nr:metal-dependent transcriptional regulator [Chloroflexota bacterium]